MELDQLYIKSVLDYDPDTGIFTWINCSKHAKRFEGQTAGSVSHDGYRRILIAKKTYLSHRLAFLYVTGEFPKQQVDHINGERDDNRYSNLRPVDCTENTRNSKRRSDNTSGATGVYWCIAASKWQACISVSKKFVHLGLYDEFWQALATRKIAERKHGFHPNHGRIV